MTEFEIGERVFAEDTEVSGEGIIRYIFLAPSDGRELYKVEFPHFVAFKHDTGTTIEWDYYAHELTRLPKVGSDSREKLGPISGTEIIDTEAAYAVHKPGEPVELQPGYEILYAGDYWTWDGTRWSSPQHPSHVTLSLWLEDAEFYIVSMGYNSFANQLRADEIEAQWLKDKGLTDLILAAQELWADYGEDDNSETDEFAAGVKITTYHLLRSMGIPDTAAKRLVF